MSCTLITLPAFPFQHGGRLNSAVCRSCIRFVTILCFAPKTTMFYDGQNCAPQHWLCRFYSHYRITLSQTVDSVCAVSQFTLDRHLQAGAFTKVPDKRVCSLS